MTEREQLEKAIDLLEKQRDVLGDVVIETALAPLQAKLTALNQRVVGPLVGPISEPGSVDSPQTPPFVGERRVITILFSDVKSSTAMAEKIDPEEWARTIQRALEYMTGPVRRHDGTIAEVRGDGVLAFFGAPLAHEDDPQRAVQAGLEIIEGIHTFQEQIEHKFRLDFDVRVGIHTGLVVVGDVGVNQQGEYAAFGDAVNLAARMEQTAQPGTIQISAQTYRLVKQIFTCEPLGEIKVKGKSRPVQTYKVLGLKPEPAPLRGLERQGLHSPLVGRETEFAAMKESLDQLLAGQGGILGILGEAGIGKSRLIEEIRQDLPMDCLRWIEGHAQSYGPSIPYRPFQEMLRCYAGISDQDNENQAWDKLENQITVLFPDNITEILPYLASLLVLPMKSEYLERMKYLNSEALGKQIFLATRRFFRKLASAQPLTLVFEDLQWVDESSINLLEHLLPLVEQVPLLIIFISRPLGDTSSGHLLMTIEKDYIERYTAVQILPLPESNSARLMHNLLESDVLPQELRALILNKAEGNPFFLEEILRALIDLGAIQREGHSGHWQTTAQIESLAIPDTVQGVILARLDRLEEEVKQVLRVASVIGRSFFYRVLQAVAEPQRRLDEHLAELQTIEFIQEKQHTPELEYVFKHALVHEATYESILFEKRRELHAQIGAVIETLFADCLEEFYGQLADHYAKAEAWEKALAYLLKAADQAGRIAADGEALEQYRQALAAYARAFGEQWDPIERATLERKIGDAFFRRGQWVEAFEFLQRALFFLGHPLPKSRWGVRSALFREITQQINRSLLPDIFHRQDARPAAEEELHIYQTLDILIAARDPELFLLLAFRMLNFSEQNNLPIGVVRASAGLGIVFGEFLRIPRLARYYLHKAVRLADQLQRPDALGISYASLMGHEGIMQGDWDSAQEYGQLSTESLREIGNLGEYSVSVFIASTILIWRGDFVRALADGREQAQIGQDAAESQTLASGLWVQGFAERCLGQIEAGIAHLNQASEVAEASENIFLYVQAANQLGQCYLRQGQWQAALDILESNYDFIVEHNFTRAPFPNAVLRNGLAATYLMAAEQCNLQKKNAWLKKAKRACRTALKWGKFLRPGRPEALRLQGQYMWLRGNVVQARRWWQMSLAEAEALGMPYELGLTHLEIGQRLGDRAHLKEAESIFARLGAGMDLARTSKLSRRQ